MKSEKLEYEQSAALYAAWTVAVTATLGSLFIGEVLGHPPCILCWYQRIAMFPLALLMGLACFRGDIGIWRYALPLAVAGGAVALYHSALFAGLIPEPIVPCTKSGPSCTDANMMIFGVLPIPVLSLAAFLAIIVCLALIARSQRTESFP
jgi:disulfide bond formation protein DsbB